MKNLFKDRKKLIFAVIAIGLVVIIVVSIVLVRRNVSSKASSESYNTVTVKYGSLVSGVSSSGSIDIGTVTQTFDLDMSALQRADTSSDSGQNSGGSGGMGGSGTASFGGSISGGSFDPFSQITSMSGSSTFTQDSSSSSIEVTAVLVSVGQNVSVGDALYELDEDSVNALKTELETNVDTAKADLDAVYADQATSKISAEYTYKESQEYGKFAQTEYDTTIASLEQAVTEAQTQVDKAQTNLDSYQEQLSEMRELYDDYSQALANCKWSMENTGKDDDSLYNYVLAFEDYETALQAYSEIGQKYEKLEEQTEQAQSNLDNAKNSLAKAKRQLASGKLSADETLQLRLLADSYADETYDITLSYLEDDAAEQESTYAEAQEKWNEFDTYIDGNIVRSNYNGVVTSVLLAEGDSMTTGSELITLYDMDEVTMTVTIDDSDMDGIVLGSSAQIVFTAYPDDIFDAIVTYIAEAESDSSGNATRDVTITLSGDVSGLYQGMTGDITFVSDKSDDILYVNKRAVVTEDEKSYVYVLDESGNEVKKEVTIGFANNSFVEISGDIAEGDTLVIKRK